MPHNSRRVAVGASGSPGSFNALRLAIERARALDAVPLPVMIWEAPGPYPQDVTDGWADVAEARLVSAFDQGLGGAPSELPTEPHVVRGRAGRVLVAFRRPDRRPARPRQGPPHRPVRRVRRGGTVLPRPRRLPGHHGVSERRHRGWQGRPRTV